jgi:predicted TIM-barrel fold metal-dependent hydrolase
VLPAGKRAKLVSTTRDVRRNYEVAAWAVRKHLDYVATFNLQLRNRDEALNARIERLMEWWGEPANCDVRRVHPFWRFGRPGLTDSPEG